MNIFTITITSRCERDHISILSIHCLLHPRFFPPFSPFIIYIYLFALTICIIACSKPPLRSLHQNQKPQKQKHKKKKIREIYKSIPRWACTIDYSLGAHEDLLCIWEPSKSAPQMRCTTDNIDDDAYILQKKTSLSFYI